tara:strand:- start:84 stop:497 length:414 start_codon:yes stop_codon:yes gene_type:complete
MMDETPRQKLARLMAGTPANSSPMPNMSSMPSAAPNPYGFLPPYTGLRNAQALPAFEQPGGSLPMERYMQPRPAPAPMPAAQPQAAPAPMPQQQAGGQGWGGPEPAPGTIPPEYDPMTDPRYLPEQWRGAFNPRWQS